jgi:hypothetical protein
MPTTYTIHNPDGTVTRTHSVETAQVASEHGLRVTAAIE